MPTLLLTPRFTPDSIALLGAAQRAGWATARLHGWRIPPEAWATDALAFYGEPLLAAALADQAPFVLLEPTFDWLPSLPEPYRKRAVRLTTLGAARRLPQSAFPAFVKPADDKCFAARVYATAMELPETPQVLPDATPTLVAEPVVWEVEFRCFVLERRVVALSPYARNGELAQTADGAWPATPTELAAAQSFAATLLADVDVRLPAAVALDVGVIAGRGWAVVEANAAWGSGLYGCDPNATLPTLLRATVARDRLSPADAQWVVARTAE